MDSRLLKEFEKDLRFYQLFLLLINKGSLMNRVDLVWAQADPAGRVGVQSPLRTEDLAADPNFRSLPCDAGSAPRFCCLVNDNGRHEANSCAISDRAAESRVRQSGKSEVYRCHAGLIDIAVPVIAEGRHIATLFAGQVLTEAPSQSGFQETAAALAPLSYIASAELEEAYWQVPVVSRQEIDSTTRVLELFAQCLATSWTRLSNTVRAEQQKTRELQLARKEFAHLVLEGTPREPTMVRELMRKIGFTDYPNRVLLVKLESKEEYHTPTARFDVVFARALQAVEELCEEIPNVCCAYLRNRGICLFLCDREDAHPGFKVQALAQKLLNAIAGRCDLEARVGIGRAKADWHSLLDSYHEAALALAHSSHATASYEPLSTSSEVLSKSVAALCHLLADRKLAEARRMLVSMPLQANQAIGDRPEHVATQQQFFSYALQSLSYTAEEMGAGPDALRRPSMGAGIELAGSVYEMQDAFLRSAESLFEQVRWRYSGTREKLVERACRKIDQELEEPSTAKEISIPRIASFLCISTGHLSRIFKECKKMTLERYLMARRIELAKRLLLEPLANVAIVAERCGFSDPTYFARVFGKVAGCSPSQYRKDPMRPASGRVAVEASKRMYLRDRTTGEM